MTARPPPVKVTKGIIIPVKRKMVALTVKEIVGDCSVEDFQKWIRNFARNDSGHFVDAEVCGEFSTAIKEEIDLTYGGYVDTDAGGDIALWIVNYESLHPGCFKSQEAAIDFGRQVVGYIQTDGYIGGKTHAEHSQPGTVSKQPSPDRRRRRKTS